MGLGREIALRRVSFTYPGAETNALKDLDVTIPCREVVGFVGETGAGKTTLVDLILGLLEPTTGTIEVDGSVLDAVGRRAWRQACGYIPQEIFLSDDSIRANIALGIPEDMVDEESLKHAARTAQIHDFIEGLPAKYKTTVGERGIRLSGGQRQRIGIARALYNDPDVLVMDEATSSLDGITETAVMEMINCLGHTKTLIIIAHRLSTVRTCNTIHIIHDGAVIASGSYDELVRTNVRFRTMAGIQGPAAVPDYGEHRIL
jgi:ABC-type multidrug transport system fused ATPase/permease subunit